MYEDFDYITDANFLSSYWWQEKTLCPYCKSTGKLSFDSEEEMIECHLCNGTGWVSHQQYQNAICHSSKAVATTH